VVNNMKALSSAEPRIEDLLRSLIAASQFELTFSMKRHPGFIPELTVEFFGPDTTLLTAHQGELLLALEHLTAKVIGLEPEDHHLLSFDADRLKESRDRKLRELTRRAAAAVEQTRKPFVFDPMSSHERRMLHLTFTEMGLRTASTGDGPRRAVVLYPPGPDAQRDS